MTEQELRQEITKAIKKGWITKGGFHTDVAIDEVYKMMLVKKYVVLDSVSNRYLFYRNENDSTVEFEIKANSHDEAYKQAYETHGPQVETMMCKVLYAC